MIRKRYRYIESTGLKQDKVKIFHYISKGPHFGGVYRDSERNISTVDRAPFSEGAPMSKKIIICLLILGP